MKLVLPFVETMITQACNISCEGCTNYSDLVHNGYQTWEQGRAELEPWLERLDIPDFGIIGGEPLMNPGVRRWITGLRDLLPHSQLRFTTNALLLERNFDIVDLLASVGNCVLKITVHMNNPELDNMIQQIMSKFTWEPVCEHGINRFKTVNNFRFQINRPKIFTRSFQGTYKNMSPHNNVPEDAFDVCSQKTCPLLYKGKIYKCSTSALLADTLARFDWPNSEQWQPYLVPGLTANCDDEELQQFIGNFNQPHAMCAMCPSQKNTDSFLIHYDHVSKKKHV
jgi:hypothetical protein